jgi:S1-C subfamily serine protease
MRRPAAIVLIGILAMLGGGMALWRGRPAITPAPALRQDRPRGLRPLTGPIERPGQAAARDSPRFPGGHLLTGRVLDVGGGPIGGARLSFSLFGPPAPGQTPVAVAADGTGAYRVALPAGTHHAFVQADGYAPARAPVAVFGAQARDFRLQPASTIAGRVVRHGTGAPVNSARVRAESRGYFAEAETDAEGAFLIADLEAGDYAVRAQAGPLAGRSVRPVVVGVAERVDGVVIEVETARAISGRVSHRGGGPVAGARVELAESTPFAGGGILRGEALSGADGRYRLEGVLPGTYRLSAAAAGLARGNRPVTVAGADVTGADVELGATGLVRGRVLDAQDRPVAGATVRVSRQMNNVSNDSFGPVRSGEDGRFTVEYVDPGQIAVIANHADKGTAAVDVGTLGPGEEKEVTLRLRGGGVHLRGRVLWDDGTPAVGLVVSSNSAARWEVGSSTATGPDGRYSVGPFGVGLLVFLSVEQVAGWEGARLESQVGRPVRIERPGDVEGIDFKLPKPDARIAGMVVGADGKPVPGAVVWTRPGRAGARVVTDDDGRFAVEGLVRERYLVHAEQPGFPPAEIDDVAAGTVDLRIQIAAGAVLAGKVVRASGATGPYTIWAQPARGAAAPALDRRLAPVADRWVDAADGAFTLTDLPPGRYDLVALAVDGASGSLPGLAVRAGEKRQGLRVELGGGAAVTGRLVDLDSRAPLPGAPVRAVADGRTTEATTDAGGTFRLEGLARGVPGEVLVDLPGYVAFSRNFTGPVERPVLDLGTLPVLPERFVHKNNGRIGMTFSRDDDGQILVRNAIDGSPAGKAGLKSGDVILAIDGRSVTNADMRAVVILVGGPPGTPLLVDVRSGSQPARQVRIVRM